jgi:hypothetical protein
VSFSGTPAGTRMREYLWRLEGERIPARGCLELGERSRAINRCAENSQCDVIVIGAHDATSRAWLIGLHVSDRVVRKASCPVIVVHPSPPAALRANPDRVEPASSRVVRLVERNEVEKEGNHERDPQHPED